MPPLPGTESMNTYQRKEGDKMNSWRFRRTMKQRKVDTWGSRTEEELENLKNRLREKGAVR